jgi:hypothetical protein
MAGMARPQLALREMLFSVSLLAASFALLRASFLAEDHLGVVLFVWGIMCIGASLGSALGATVGGPGVGIVYGLMGGVVLAFPAGILRALFIP